MFNFRNEDENEDCIEISVYGFKALTHKRFLETIEKKLLVKRKRKDYVHFELIVPTLRIPYVKDKTFPSLKILATSSATELKIKLIGESSFIFVLFYLKKCLEIYIKELPGTLSDCFSFEDGPATSTDGDDTDSTDSLPKAKKTYRRIIRDSSSDESNKEPGKPVHGDDSGSKCLDGLSVKDKESETSTPGSIRTLPESGSPVFKSRIREKEREDEMECMGCAMLFVSRNVETMVASDYMPLSLACTASCLDPDTPDAMDDMLYTIFTMISRTDYVTRSTLGNFRINFARICNRILDRTAAGKEGFFVQLLTSISRIKVKDANKVVTVLNEVVLICLGDVKSFEEKLTNSKAARRNIVSFIKSTGAFFSVIAVIETLYKMFQKKVDLKKILPSQLCFVVDMFENIKAKGSDSIIVYHESMSVVARNILTVIGGKKIQAIELKKKEFRVKETGRSINVPHDLFLYHSNDENTFTLFLFPGNLTLAETIDLKSLCFEKEENRLITEKWILELKSRPAEDLIQIFVIPHAPTGNKENEKEDDVNSFRTEERRDDKPKEKEDEDNKNGEYENDFDGSEGHSFQASDAGQHFEDRRHCVIEKSFTVEQNNIQKYWPPNENLNKKRQFNPTTVSSDWPRMYGGVCPLTITQNYVTKYGSRKTNANFGKVVGKCVVCDGKHTFIIEDNPFEEMIEGGLLRYKPTKDMRVDVEAEGDFFVEDGEEPNIQKPVHMKSKARGLHLKGRERELLGDMAAQQGVQATHRQQMAFALEEEIEVGNTTSMRSYPVIKMAKQEQEKKQRGGATFYESARNVLLGQDVDVSPDFPDLAAAKLMPGMIRSLQEYPFKITLSNFEMLRIGAKFFSGVEETTLYIDSSGKFWQERKKTGKDLLNTALVLPPLADGLSPFPIFELISEQNKTQDFIDMIQHAWNNMALSINNRPVPFPNFAVSDLSFPNFHALLMVFNKCKLHEYLNLAYECLMKGDDISLATTITICVNHLLPAILKTSRAHIQDKCVADTVVAGLMLVLRADSMASALTIWEALVKVHCEKGVNEDARAVIKAASIGNFSSFEMVTDFDDDTPNDELVMYGNRRALRLNSDFYHLFKRTIEKVEKEDENVMAITNRLHAPSLIKFLNKQYLSLFPLMSAAVLKGGGLKSNSHIELYWKAKRATMAKVPSPQHWPAKLIGIQHHETRRQAKEIALHSLVPNLKFGGKKFSHKGKFPDLMHDLSGRQSKGDKFFMPTPSKKERKERRQNESYDGSKEQWGPKKSKIRNNNHYMKNKILDHDRIEIGLQSRDEISQKSGNVDKADNRQKTGNIGQREEIRITNVNKGGVVLSEQDVTWLMSDDYISDNVVYAGLLLLDKRLNDPNSKSSDVVNVYSISDLRLILSGEGGIVKTGKFICIMPRNFALVDYDEQQEQSGCHFTLLSNLYCEAFEVNCYETFTPFRTQTNLLTTPGKKLVRMLLGLSDSDPQQVEVNSVNVPTQRENECGALAFAIALQLCFHYPLGGVYSQIQNVRGHLLTCLQRNELSDFMTIPNSVTDALLFTINI